MTKRAWLLLLAAAVLLLFAHGRWMVAAAAFVAPALLVRFLRAQTFSRALLAGTAALSIASYVWWRGVFPLSGLRYVIAALVLGVLTLVPYLLDRWLAPRLGAFTGTLVLPAAMVALELLNSVASPFGSWGAVAYSQAGNLPLIQLVSVTGLAGVTFLVLWFATIVNGPRRGWLVYGAVLAAVYGFGIFRLQSGGATETVRIAALTPRIPTYTVRGDAANQAVYDVLRTRAPKNWDAFRQRAAQINGELFAESERSDANLVVWSEGAGIVERQDEAALIQQAAGSARKTNRWIALSFLTVDGRGSRPFENKNVLVDPTGKTIWTYRKAHPVPMMEACVPGDGRIPMAPTPFGRIATVICFDADFPRLIRRAAGADILLVPADDWREIAPLHTSMVKFRALEQGFSLVRATSNGDSVVVDRYGRIRVTSDYFTGARTLVADVPRAGAPTIYTRAGDVAAWCGVLVFAALLAVGALRRRVPDVVLAIDAGHAFERG